MLKFMLRCCLALSLVSFTFATTGCNKADNAGAGETGNGSETSEGGENTGGEGTTAPESGTPEGASGTGSEDSVFGDDIQDF